MPQVMTAGDMRRAVRRISHEIIETHRGTVDVVLVGIHTRGVHLAREIARSIEEFEGALVPVGELDVASYRDDIDTRSRQRRLETSISFEIEGKHVVVVDDVLYTGRTVRAALDALTDLGRARTTELAVMVDRGHRELPIRADYVGKNLPTARDERVWVRVADVDGQVGVWIEKVAA
jgi:pyrimidine operon attenuation protein/uracil phosphoribosyltransferase